MKLIEKPLKVSYTNPIKDWYEENKTNTPIKDEGVSYENGMFISINNSKCFYSDLVKDFKELYISFILSLTGFKTSKWDVDVLQGGWKKDRVALPDRNKLLNLISNKTPILLGAVHNYKKDDFRSAGKEYCHTHFFIYNIHHYLPSNKKELRDIEDKIERYLSRYIKAATHKKFQGVINITPVIDKIQPIELFDYLLSPINKPTQDNLINYMANNRHLPSIQYPLTTIYSSKKL